MPAEISKELREIQGDVEAAKIDLKTRRILFAKQDISNAQQALGKYTNKILKFIPKEHLEIAKSVVNKFDKDIPIYMQALSAAAAAGMLLSLSSKTLLSLYSFSVCDEIFMNHDPLSEYNESMSLQLFA
jgi:hypothetical protein